MATKVEFQHNIFKITSVRPQKHRNIGGVNTTNINLNGILNIVTVFWGL